MQKETVPRNPWPILIRSCYPCTNDWKQSRWRSLSTMGCCCRWRSHSPFDRTRILLLQEQMVASFPKQGSNTMPLRIRSVFMQALSTLCKEYISSYRKSQQQWLRELYKIYTNFTTNEDNNHDTKYTNKNDTNNHDARDLHEWAQQRVVCCVFCPDVESWSSWLKPFTCLSSSRHVIMMCVSLWLLHLPCLFRLDLPRLLPLFCPDAPWRAHRPRQPGLRGK